MKKNIYILFFCLSFCSDVYEYKIKSFGIQVAKCSMSIKDTVYDNNNSILLKFTVNTLNIFDVFYPINNKYTIIVDDKSISTKYFKKHTTQPKIINSIETTMKDDMIYYIDSDYLIPPNTLNIFSLLYFLMIDPIQINSNQNNILEREGKFYSYSIVKDNEKYKLDISPQDDDVGLIKHTDIFTWAIFKDDVKRYLYIDNNKIQKCVVKSGILNFTAEYIE